MTRDRLHVIDGGANYDPDQQDDEDATAAVGEVIAGPDGPTRRR